MYYHASRLTRPFPRRYKTRMASQSSRPIFGSKSKTSPSANTFAEALLKFEANQPNTAKPAIAPRLHMDGQWRGLADSDRSPKARAQRARLKSCRDDAKIAQGKRGTSAALGCWHKMIFFPFLKFGLVPKDFGTRPNFKKGKSRCVWRLPMAAAATALPWAIIMPPLAGLRRPNEWRPTERSREVAEAHSYLFYY